MPHGRARYDRRRYNKPILLANKRRILTGGVSGVVGREVVDIDEDAGLVLGRKSVEQRLQFPQ